MEIIIGRDMVSRSLPTGITPILFSLICSDTLDLLFCLSGVKGAATTAAARGASPTHVRDSIQENKIFVNPQI